MNKELEEAIKILTELKDNVALFSTGWKSILKQEEQHAIETVLNYIDNSIPKEVIKKKIEELKLGQETTNKSSWCNIYQYQILILQELLEGK